MIWIIVRWWHAQPMLQEQPCSLLLVLFSSSVPLSLSLSPLWLHFFRPYFAGDRRDVPLSPLRNNAGDGGAKDSQREDFNQWTSQNWPCCVTDVNLQSRMHNLILEQRLLFAKRPFMIWGYRTCLAVNIDAFVGPPVLFRVFMRPFAVVWGLICTVHTMFSFRRFTFISKRLKLSPQWACYCWCKINVIPRGVWMVEGHCIFFSFGRRLSCFL